MRYDYDFALAGSTGQLGQVLLKMLEGIGTVHLIRRGDVLFGAPTARHVINAAGYTKFDDNIKRYWQDNIRFAVELSNWAETFGSYFHQLSSEAVAEYRKDVLTESSGSPRAHPSMIDYALSKVLTEQAVQSTMSPGKLSIYRTADFVPSPGHFAEDWRKNHWLTILFQAGKTGFNPGDDFPVWVATTGDVARAIALLIMDPRVRNRAYHLLGHVYYWSQFQEAAQVGESASLLQQRMVDTVRAVVRIDPPLANCIVQYDTKQELGELGFQWEYLELDYWQKYGKAGLLWN